MKSPACCPCPVSCVKHQAGVALITVLLIVFLGATIGFVVVALYLPIISIPVHLGRNE